MKVFHGSTTYKVHSLVSGDFSKIWPGLNVTDSFERAATYANAQASWYVDPNATVLVHKSSVVVEIEIDELPRWQRRPESHNTLDKCEAIIKRGKIVKIYTLHGEYPGMC